ncbi:MFS transporter [Geodermatophilus sp. DF01_2]|uniref:MFS transporter n=1 Tax=Geodermatophilus sp. DF01-2 TaxID=2559610 RepID=UPI0014309EE0|nr:MFS transporter [Geodermatophilus sp. DF01_2]
MAAGVTTMGTLPIFLLTAQAVLVQQDLGVSNAQVGTAATVFFATAALGSVPAGRLAERLGGRASPAVAGLLAVVSLLGIALFPVSYAFLLAFLVVGGLGNAMGQVSANVLLAQVVPARRQGVAFGVKQSAIPISTLLGGLAVPAIGLTLGWRWAYAGAAAFALTMALVAPQVASRPQRTGRASGPPFDAVVATATASLIVIAIGTGLASAGTNALGAYLVIWSVHIGVGAGAAGLLLAAASLLSITARILSGVAADRRGGRNLPVVAGQLAVGAVSLLLLATGGTTALVVGALAAFAIGWSWPGLLIFAVVRSSPGSPAVSTSIIQVGAFVGGASGPGLFGLLVGAFSFEAAWRAAACSLALAAVLMLVGRRLLVTALGRRTPVVVEASEGASRTGPRVIR